MSSVKGSASRAPQKGRLRLAADIGGTFTDIAAFDEGTGELLFGKTLSTHGRLVDGIADGIAKAGADFADSDLFIHGSTIAINTILERKGARTALVVTEGFRDVYEIGRINRPDAYNLFFEKHEPLVERALRFEVRERMRADGEVHIPLDDDEVRTVAARLRAAKVEAVGIFLLHSYRNPAHEKRVADILQAELPGVFVTASHTLSQEYREFERCSTTAANAYVGPRVDSYVGEIERHLQDASFPGSFFVVQSSGGLYNAAQARKHCIRMLESGPAAGVIGAKAVAEQLGLKNVIAFDMGGTTAKAGVIYEGKALSTGSALIGGYDKALPVQITMMDIHEVGTGGGSIARVSDLSGLRVGPQSAGSEPGPACYGRGGIEPTVTDANLVLGRLHADRFLGGEMALNLEAAQQAINSQIAEPLGIDSVTAADGVLRIASTSMSHAVRAVTVDRGLDPGAFVMVVYGGAGPLHSTAIAREIGVRQVIIPHAPGQFSAYGMLFSDMRHDFVRTFFMQLEEVSFGEIEILYAAMEKDGIDEIQNMAVAPEQIVLSRAADMRYVGQEHSVTVDLPLALFRSGDRAAIKAHFDALHETRYGVSSPGEAAEIVTLRSTAIGVMGKPPQNQMEPASGPVTAALTGTRQVYFGRGGFLETPTYARASLRPGHEIPGPALIEEHASTTVLEPGDHLTVDPFGNLLIEVGAGERAPAEKAESTLDPVVAELVRFGVTAVTEEMKTALMRTAYNMIIYESLDFTVGLFTAKGETVSIGLGLPMFIRGMAETVKEMLAHFGPGGANGEGIHPGDILVTNDAYITGSHLNHVTFALPVFHDGELVGFTCCMAHWPDIGGVLNGMTTDIYSEGLQIPILKYHRAGKLNQDLLDIIQMNVRLPDRALGDLRAQIIAVKTGERRFLELIGRYGRRAVLDGIDRLMDRSEASARALTRTIPDGVYEAESFMDDDGLDIGTKVAVRVKVIKKGDQMTIDLSDVSKQVKGFFNSGITTGFACAQVAFKCLTSPTDYPINEGSFRPLDIILPLGRVVSAEKPAPMRWWMTFPMTVVDTIFKALAPAIPDRVIAGHHADLVCAMFNGVKSDGEFFLASAGPIGGGWGAKSRADGVSATVCINDGDTHNAPIEQFEAKSPVLVERYALVPDSGGPGRHRGGLGTEMIVRAEQPLTINTQIDRANCAPWGLEDGGDGAGNAVELRVDGEWRTDFSNAKLLTSQIKRGDAFLLRSGGGGGFGPAHERDRAAIAEDIRQGYVTVKAAKRDYNFEDSPQLTSKVEEKHTA